MKKAIFFVVLLAMCLAFYSVSFAADKTEAKGSMMGEKGKTMHHGMMMKKMMQKEVVVTPDGGVIVLIGNKLIKYDKDLNLVKEAEIKVDMEAMMKQMKECSEMMKKCKMDEEVE
ncbi:MAG: hypothetical protein Q8N67_01260 [Candidatus Omnitrophota bacterium]|nr:hypothetical protein [Candidatus Omnitrophota bacterium]